MDFMTKFAEARDTGLGAGAKTRVFISNHLGFSLAFIVFLVGGFFYMIYHFLVGLLSGKTEDNNG